MSTGEQPNPQRDSVFGDVNQLMGLLHDLDERGLVLSLAAFAEEALGQLILAFMRPVKTSKQLLEGFNAPLGTFSSRIKAALSLGLVTADQFEDLECLRKIRNEFAHGWRPLSLNDSEIEGHILKMNYSTIDDRYPETRREKLSISISALLVELRSSAHQIEKKQLGAKEIGGRLFALFGGDIEQGLATARADLNRVKAEVQESSGERLAFFQMLSRRLEGKLYLLYGNAPNERKPDVLALLDEVKQVGLP